MNFKHLEDRITSKWGVHRHRLTRNPSTRNEKPKIVLEEEMTY